MGKLTRVGLVVACAVVGWVPLLGSIAPLLVGVLLVAANIAAARWAAHRWRGTDADSSSFILPLTACWLAIAMLPVHNFATRSTAAAVTSLGIQPLIELMVFTAAGAVALAVIRSFEPTLARAQPPLLLFLLPTWIVASTMWSPSGLYSWVRGMQMVVIALVAWATIAIGRSDIGAVEAIIQGVLRWFVWITLVLVALGAAFGPIYVTAIASNLERFGWIGAHPTNAGVILAVAIIIVMATPSAVLRFPPLVHAGALGALVVAMYLNHSRASWIGLLVAAVVVLGLKGRLSWMLRSVAMPAFGAVGVLAVYFRGPEIVDYFLRNRDTDTFLGGNGRRELWNVGIRSLDGPFDWFAGHGYGITRSLFQPEASWAGDAHNSVIAFLVSTGLIGVALFAAMLILTGWRLFVSRAWLRSPSGIALASVLVVTVVNALSTDTMAEPTIGYVLLNLIAAALTGRGAVGSRRSAPASPAVAADVRRYTVVTGSVPRSAVLPSSDLPSGAFPAAPS